jgi:hypothetical protein
MLHAQIAVDCALCGSNQQALLQTHLHWCAIFALSAVYIACVYVYFFVVFESCAVLSGSWPSSRLAVEVD